MSNWSGTSRSGSDGILRGVATKEREELLVFGYSCKIFRDDDRAREVDQGKLLIPWCGDETLRIDRYDARGALHELSRFEAPPGGHDWRLELTDAERKVEQLCDEERYRALYCDEEEELMYKEEELKRLRAAGYGQIGFNYDAQQAPETPSTEQVEADEPFVPTPQMQALLTPDITLPDTQKLNAIIEKTATFIARQGTQMEILLRAKQAGNPQFDFLDKDCPLHRYYTIVVDAVRNDKLNPKAEPEEEKLEENENYLHPALATAPVESAPLIPSIQYKPSADCDYTMLISRIRGTRDDSPSPPPAGELPPPGTRPLTLPSAPHIARGPVLYNQNSQDEAPAPTPPPASAPAPPPAPAGPPPHSNKSTALHLMQCYNSDSESEQSSDEDEGEKREEKRDEREEEKIREEKREMVPPEDVKVIIDKMAAYVARNGDEFQEIVKAKNDPRFTFLDSGHAYYPFYRRLMLQKRGVAPSNIEEIKREVKSEKEKGEKEEKKRVIVPVSFSIKKLKEPEPILPKPALPYESSDEEKEKEENNTQEQVNKTTPVVTPEESPQNNTVQHDELIKIVDSQINSNINRIESIVTEEKPPPPPKESPKKEKKKDKSEKKRKKEKRSENGEHKKSKRDRSRERKRSRSRERSAERDRTSKEDKKRKKKEKVIDIDCEDVFIDLTDDGPEGKTCDADGEKAKQLERKRRAAEFLAKMAPDAPPQTVMEGNTLASAMVKTLVDLQAKKDAEELKQKKRERLKRKHKKRDESNEREKDRSHRKSKRRKHKSSSEEEGNHHESSTKHRKHKKEKKQKKKRKRPPSSDREHTPQQEEQRKVDFNPEDIKSKLKKLREESDEELEAKKWHEEPEAKKTKEYSEGEITSTDGRSSEESDA